MGTLVYHGVSFVVREIPPASKSGCNGIPDGKHDTAVGQAAVPTIVGTWGMCFCMVTEIYRQINKKINSQDGETVGENPANKVGGTLHSLGARSYM